MDRQLAAYGLILLMLAALAAVIAYQRYNTRDRRVERRRVRERAAQEKRRAEVSGGQV